MKNDRTIKNYTVQILSKNNPIGTGVLLPIQDKTKGQYLILTAAHCLYNKNQTKEFESWKEDVAIKYPKLEIEDSPIKCSQRLVDLDNDVAILLVSIELSDNNQEFSITDCYYKHNNYSTIGYPQATRRCEEVQISLTWQQDMQDTGFQLEMKNQYTACGLKGLSGAGVFHATDYELFLVGIVTQVREDGSILYCKPISFFNRLLQQNNLTIIPFDYYGGHGISSKFITKIVDKSVSNLGQRFNPTINYKTDTSKLFDALSYGGDFVESFISEISALLNTWFRPISKESKAYHLEEKYQSSRDKIIELVNKGHFTYMNPIDIEQIRKIAESCNNDLYNFWSKLDIRESKDEKNVVGNRMNYIESILELISNQRYSLANNKDIIIIGEAGSGKSHLLGDIAKSRVDNNKPVVFLIGGNFQKHETIETNILKNLDLRSDISFDDLLNALEVIAEQVGERVLFMIDAINESRGKDVWRNSINSFVDKFKNRAGVSLVLSLRTTYKDDILPEGFDKLVPIEHHGFKGSEYEALHLFSQFYKVKVPDFPLLEEEYSNPLFLHMLCKVVQENGGEFPVGIDGLNNLFDSYLKILDKELADKHDEYRNRKIVSKSAKLFADSVVANHCEFLSVDEAFDVFENKFTHFPNLVTHLIDSCFFMQEKKYGENGYYDAVVVSFQRLSDYFIAESLIDGKQTFEELLESVKEGGALQKIFTDYYWYNKGVIECLFYMFPERFGVELFALLTETRIDIFESDLCELFFESLPFRSKKSFNREFIDKLLKNSKSVDLDWWFLFVLKASCLPEHPYNSDYLFIFLSSFTLPKRDSFWQHVLTVDTVMNANSTINKLIRWGMVSNIHNSTPKIIRLVAQTLIWVLCATNPKLRVEASVVLIRLLHNDIPFVITLLQKYEKVDDPYLYEMLYAVAYGCVLKNNTGLGVGELANNVYNKVFASSVVPNIAIRDYARNIVEYAIAKGQYFLKTVNSIRPPYKSVMPCLPSEGDIQKYKFENDYASFEKHGLNNEVYSSLIDEYTSYGHKEIKPDVERFCCIPAKEHKKILRWINSNNPSRKTFLELYDNCMSANLNIFDVCGEERLLCYCEDEYDCDFLINSVLPYIKMTQQYDGEKMDSMPVRRWMVKRVFDLGYSVDLHGGFDCYSTGKIRHDSIREKYIRIAWLEILAYLSDNYLCEDFYDKYGFSQGPWNFYERIFDVGAVDLLCDKLHNPSTEIEDWLIDNVNIEWSDPEDGLWSQKEEGYSYLTDMLEKTDTFGKSWLSLRKNNHWNEPEASRLCSSSSRKEVWHWTNAYIVKKKDKVAMIDFLTTHKFSSDSNPKPPYENTSYVFFREMFCMPIYDEYRREERRYDATVWKKLKDSKLKVKLTSAVANSNFSYDPEHSNVTYWIPSREIFKDLELEYAAKDGYYVNKQGSEIAFSVGNSNLLIDKSVLIDYLNSKGYDIVWAMYGERNIILTSGIGPSPFYKILRGVFYLNEENNITGNVKTYDR